MRNSNHLSREELAQFLAGMTIDDAWNQAVESHLEMCAECQRTAEQIAPGPLETAIRDSSYEVAERPRLGARYDLLQEIGRGAGGIVYLARQPKLNRLVAVKMLLSGVHASRTERKRFQREADALARLNHPHVVQVYDSGEQDDVPFIAMELLQGPTLAQALRQRLPTPIFAARLVADLADAMATAHQLGMVHRDLKPQNVLLVDSSATNGENAHDAWVPTDFWKEISEEKLDTIFCYTAKITDFGLTLLVDDTMQTQAGMPLGTPAYMAPEAVRGDRRELGPATDIYGLGAILYECLTGRPPFVGHSTAEILRSVTDTDVVPIHRIRSDVPRDLITICQRCLAKQPHDRFASAEDLRDDLRRFLRHEPIRSRPLGALARGVKWIRRNPWPATAGAIVLAAVAMAVGGLLIHQRELFRRQQIAWAKYDEARNAIWEMLDQADQQNAFDIPRLRQLAVSQAERALELFADLAREAPTVSAQRDLARVRIRVGTLMAAGGETARAEDQFEQAWQLLASLDNRESSNQQSSTDLITAQVKLGATLRSRQRFTEAIAVLEQAEPKAVAMLSQRPRDVGILSQLAWLRHNLANAHYEAGNVTTAIALYRQAVELCTRALSESPRNREIQRSMSESQTSLAVALMKLGKHEQAERMYRQAAEQLSFIVQDDPKDVTALTSLGMTYLNLSNISAGKSELANAIDLCTQGIQSVEKVLAVDQNNQSTRRTAAMLYGNRALFRMQDGELKACLADWRNGARLAAEPATRHYCEVFAVRALLAMKQSDQAARELRDIDPTDWSPKNQFVLISTWGLLLNELTSNDLNPFEPNQAAALKVEAEQRIIDGMTRLKGSGFLDNDPTIRAHVEQSEEFHAVRETVDAQRIASWFES